MRELTMAEVVLVSGGDGDSCSAEDSGSGNTYGGVSDTSQVGPDIINAYEGLVEAASYIIERVVKALD